MPYEISTNQLFADEKASSLSRLTGPVRGIATEDWPTFGGRPMQHLFTLDLQEIDLDAPAARDARLLVVFAMAFYELDPGVTDAIALRWVSQEQLDRIPQSTPPAGHEVIGQLPDSPYEEHETVLELEELEDEPDYHQDFVGGEPVWTEVGEPDEKPRGAFILQISSQEFPITRADSQLYLFEGGALIQRHDPPDDDEPGAVPWSQAIAASRELCVHDTEPEPDALQKWGGIPQGVAEDDWPEGMSHLLTFEPARWPEDGPEDAVAIAVFANLEESAQWEEEPEFELVAIDSEGLDQAVEPPEGVTVLPAKTLERRPFGEGTSYHDLRLASYEGPRLAWRRPSRNAPFEEGAMGFQLTEELLPHAPTRGTVYFQSSCDMAAHWQPAQIGAPTEGTREGGLPIEGLGGTLFEEDTGAAIVLGHALTISEELSVSLEEFQAFAAAVKDANDEHELDLELVVPGDTTTDSDPEVPSTVLVGRRFVQLDASDDPVTVDRDGLLEALASSPEIPDAYWAALEETVEQLETKKAPAAYLVSYGPLSYGALHIGQPLASSQQDDAVYDFASCQDMEQQQSEGGVDGVELASADGREIEELSWSAEAHRENLAAVERCESPVYLLVCCYD